MSDIQTTIRNYLNGNNGTPSNHDYRCFVGMLETGEAAAKDFEAVGGIDLAKEVARRMWNGDYLETT